MIKKLFYTFAFVAFAATAALAQPGFDDNDPNPGGIPVDGGASLLLASGAAFGLKKLKDARKVAAKV